MSPISPTINTTKVASTMLCLTINSEDEETFRRPNHKVRKRNILLSRLVKYVMQNELSSPPLPRNSMKTTYNTILYNVSLGYSKNFGDNIITKPNHMTRVLCQNTGSLEISTNSHKFEVIC